MAPDEPEREEQVRRDLRQLVQAHREKLMHILESAAGAGDRTLLRDMIEAAFYLYSGNEDQLPGGKEFWTTMRLSVSSAGAPPASPAEGGRRALDVFRRELLGEKDRKAQDGGPGGPAAGEGAPGTDRAPPVPRPPAPEGRPQAAGAGPPPPGAAARSSLAPFRSKPPDGATAPVPAEAPSPVPADREASGQVAELRRRLGDADAELRRKDGLLRDLEEDTRRLRKELEAHEALPPARELEERVALQDGEARMAREDLARLEKKYRENLDLLKSESRERGSLQKRLAASDGEIARGRTRLKEEELKLAEVRRGLEAKEQELLSAEERLRSAELELVRKEEEVRIALERLREEEAERRKVVERLQKEAREKVQLEHRLKRREAELSHLEARLVEEENRIEALRGSQAVSEEEYLARSAELKRREEAVRAEEARMQERVRSLRREEESVRERLSKAKEEMRDQQSLEVRYETREAMRQALQARCRSREEELTRELVNVERMKAVLAERESELRHGEAAGKAEEGPAPPPPAPGRALGRDEMLDILAKRSRRK